MARKPVNERQLEVLRWIADGCPEGVWEDFTYKTTAIALQGRRLATVSKRGGWHAEITDDGRYYLEHGAYQDEQPKPARAGLAKRKTARRAPKPVVPPANEVTERVDESSTEASPSPQPEMPTIVVPASLRKPHPAVTTLRDSKRDLGITPSVQGRALRVLHALAQAAEQRGYRVESVKKQHDSYGRSWYGSDHLIINTGETKEAVRIVQLTDRAPHVLTAKEIKEAEGPWARKPPKYDHTPNEYLRVELDASWDGSRHTWSEGPRGPIDRKLPAVLDEIERRHERAKERRVQAEAARLERERQWRTAHDRAQVLLQEHHRAEVLYEQAKDWRRAGELREYVKAMRAKADAIASYEERATASEWVEWAASFAERLDPLSRPIALPAEVEANPDALQPFMGGWSAHGPRAGR